MIMRVGFVLGVGDGGVEREHLREVSISGREVFDAMVKEKVVIGRTWPSWPTFVRVSIGTKEEMEKFKVAFGKVMNV